MTPQRPFYVWLEEQIARCGTARGLADLLGTDESKISRWRRQNLLPQSIELEQLATVTGTPFTEMLLMVWDADRRRMESRLPLPTPGRGPVGRLLPAPTPPTPPPPPLGIAAPPVVPLPKRRRGRRTLAAWLFAVASASLLGGPPAVVAARPDNGREEGFCRLGRRLTPTRWAA
jgi:hypothetical protein